MIELNNRREYYEAYKHTKDYVRAAIKSEYYPTIADLTEMGILHEITANMEEDTDMVDEESYVALSFQDAEKYFFILTDLFGNEFNNTIVYDRDKHFYYVHKDLVKILEKEKEYRMLLKIRLGEC